MKKIRGCIICNQYPVERCHIKSRGAGGPNDPDNLYYACHKHHMTQHSMGIVSFTLKYPEVLKDFESKGWELREVVGRLKLCRK